MSTRARPRLTGRHVLIVALAGFGTVIAANLAMLVAATGTFPGLVVKNSYVASQGWDGRAEAQAALGWRASAAWEGGRLLVALHDAAGGAVEGAALEATVGRPSTAAEDRTMPLVPAGDGYAAAVELSPGAWRVDIRTVVGPSFAYVDRLYVPGAR
jgi:nitrogen fixation protein FixH